MPWVVMGGGERGRSKGVRGVKPWVVVVVVVVVMMDLREE